MHKEENAGWGREKSIEQTPPATRGTSRIGTPKANSRFPSPHQSLRHTCVETDMHVEAFLAPQSGIPYPGTHSYCLIVCVCVSIRSFTSFWILRSSFPPLLATSSSHLLYPLSLSFCSVREIQVASNKQQKRRTTGI